MISQSKSTRAAATLFLLVVMAFCAIPLLSMFSAALQPQGTIPLGLSWPSELHWENFVDAWSAANMSALLFSSILLVAVVVPTVLLCATLAGYALGQLKVPGGFIVLALLLVGLSMPFEVLVTPSDSNDLARTKCRPSGRRTVHRGRRRRQGRARPVNAL